MKKKILAIILCICALGNAVFAADLSDQFEQTTIDGNMTEQTEKGGKFNLNIGMLSEKQLKITQQGFTKLDLRTYMTRDLKDDVAGDQQGGWSDQGDNDLRMFDRFGNQEMLGVPFEFVNPAQNGGKGVLGLRGQNDAGLPTSVEVAVNKKTAGAYFIQASPWCSGTCGTYTWVYADGTEAYMDIVQDEHICDFWGKKTDFDYVRCAWTTKKDDGSERSLYLFAMNNPYPDKEVKSLRLETPGGGAYIMIMAITLTDSGPYLTATESARSVTMTTYGWYENVLPDEEKVKGSAIDFSGYLDAPAGKHGRLTKDGEDFVFEDGTPARFWGADIVGAATFPEHDTADLAAARIARCGINLIRFSNFDEELLASGKSAALDADKLEKMAYFISRLKEKGVYTYVSLLSERTLKADADIENFADFKKGYGIDAFFDEDLINLQKQFASEFFGYKNPYTGVTLGDDAAIAMTELAGDLSIYDYTSGYSRAAFANDAQYEKAKKRFNDFLRTKYKTDENLGKAWTSEYDRHSYEKISDGSVELKVINDYTLLSDGYKTDVTEFFAGILSEYYNMMKKALAGAGGLVTINSNSAEKGISADDTRANSAADFTVRSAYNAMPLGGKEKLTASSVLPQNGYGSMTKNTDNMLKDFADSAAAGAPYIARWGSSAHNLYNSETPFMTAALAAQKGWSAIRHSFANGVYADKNYIDDFYGMYNNPVSLALSSVAAGVFYGGSTAKREEIMLGTGGEKLNAEQAFMRNMRVDFSDKNAKNFAKSSAKILKTDNIWWDSSNGIFETRNARTETVTGFLKSAEELPSFIIEADNDYVTAALTVLDGNDIKNADRYLVTALWRAQNSGARVNPKRNIYETLGSEPILVEPITGKFTLKITGDFEVYALNSSGERMQKLTATRDKKGYTSFKLSAQNKAIQYEIVRKQEG